MARRNKGSGGISHRKDGHWEGRVVVGYDEKNLPITKNVLAKTKIERVEKLEVLRREYGMNDHPQLKPDMEFGVWVDYWYTQFAEPKLRPTTREAYRSRIYNHIIPSLGKIPLNKLNKNDLQQFYAKLKTSGRIDRQEIYGEGLSDRVVRSCHTYCRTALEKAIAEGLIQSKPATGCKLPPKKGHEMKILKTEEMQRFLIQAREEGYYELFVLELATGLRRGEILALQWNDLNLTTGELSISRQVYAVDSKITVSVPKTKASVRTIILPPALVEMLKRYKESLLQIDSIPVVKNKAISFRESRHKF